MKRILWLLPVWLMLADMLYGFSANITKSWSLNQQELPKDGFTVAPQIAFDGLQVLANGGMILIIGFGLLVLLRLNRTVLRGYADVDRGVQYLRLVAGVGVFAAFAVGMVLGADRFDGRPANRIFR